jgi:hypothetical protein
MLVEEEQLEQTSFDHTPISKTFFMIEEDADSSNSQYDSDDDSDCDSEGSSEGSESELDSDEEALFQEQLLGRAVQNSAANGGVYVSSVVHNFLKRNMSTGDLDVTLPELVPGTEDVRHAVMRRLSDGGAPRAGGGASMVVCIQQHNPVKSFSALATMVGKDAMENANVNPMDALKKVCDDKGIDMDIHRTKDILYYFTEVKKEHIAAYDMEIMKAVRSGDLDAIKAMKAKGKQLQCCNKFRESILHTVARRGLTDMLKYLITDGGVSLKVCCDSGRTPLHDACWTSTPNFECISLILQEAPDFLFVSDNRNFTPLNYIPRDSWGEWNKFLNENTHLVAPKELVMNHHFL